MNFGETPFAYPPQDGFIPFCQAEVQSQTAIEPQGSTPKLATSRGPLALIIEPTWDLASQVATELGKFSKHLLDPAVTFELFMGGSDQRKMLRALREGVTSASTGPSASIV